MTPGEELKKQLTSMLRPQTWYLLLAAICSAIAAFTTTGTTLMLVLLIVAAVTACAVVPLYGRRKLQAAAALLPMALLLVWYVLLAVLNRNMGGEYSFHLTDAMPALAIVLVFMARKGILHDEKVVKAYDRIR